MTKLDNDEKIYGELDENKTYIIGIDVAISHHKDNSVMSKFIKTEDGTYVFDGYIKLSESLNQS